MTKIENVARQLNQLILNEPVVQEYKKYEKMIHEHGELKEAEEELKALQKQIVQQKAKQDDNVQATISLYKQKKDAFENHPLVVNYLYLQEEVNDLLQSINKQLNQQLK